MKKNRLQVAKETKPRKKTALAPKVDMKAAVAKEDGEAGSLPAKKYLFVLRHGERVDHKDPEGWRGVTENKWDPPLTTEGRRQASLAGAKIYRECKRLNAVMPTCVYSSPLLRTVETAHEVVQAMGLNEINVEAGIAEQMSRSWFLSWCLPHSDGSWGGPDKGAKPHGYVSHDVHPDAKLTPAHWYRNFASHSPLVNSHYKPVYGIDRLRVTWDAPESYRFIDTRVANTVSTLLEGHGSVVLVTHAGICNTVYRSFISPTFRHKNFYTSLNVFAPPEDDAPWRCLMKGDASHLDS
eukprot:TRINITY_DN6701_c3_g3_i1.p1 TRINITY_DN6701_c3_g3~~TRINITY_DN6701_c3_g3_i1.p1  ORF type:complete len:312 (+),score=41.37 TRINITY_DN6701_c3_g3_i1:54-938(+)